MDLLTHAAAGAALASTLRAWPENDGQAHAEGQANFDGRALLCALAASLAPDVDVLDNPFREDVGGLSYMLFHRGMSHTIVGGLVLATGIAGLVTLLTRARARAFPRLWAAAALGAGLHLVMDATNDYGVHPFWPFDGRWVYGDFIFLSEPLIWAALLPMAIAPFLRDWGSRAINLWLAFLAALLPLLVIGWVWRCVARGEWMTPLPAVLVTLWVAFQFLAYCRWFSRALGWVSVLAVWAVFFFAADRARAKALTWLEERAPGEELVQLVTTPAPANPFCFRIVSASRGVDAGELTTRLGTLSLWPSLVSPSDCYTPNRAQPPTAVLSKIADDTPSWHWVGEFRGSLAAFERYASTSCRVRWAKTFIRTPFWSEQENGRVVIGDLRFDYAYDLEHYCKYRYQAGRADSCPERSVPWEAPFFGALALREARPPAQLGARLAEKEVRP